MPADELFNMPLLEGAIILVADDERYITSMLGMRLEKAGAKVITASDGVDAYDKACAHQLSAIVSDFQMPEMNGLELCERLKATPRNAKVPAILLTARGHRVTPQQLLRTNIRRVMDKPFSAKEVLAELEVLLRESAQSV